MKEMISRDVMTDRVGAENVSKEEVKIREVVIHVKVLFIPEATVRWTDVAIRIIDLQKIEDGHHLEAEVLHYHLEILPHDPASRQKEVEFSLDKILRITETDFLTGTKKNLLKEPGILEVPDMKCHITWIWTEFLFGLLETESL